MREPDSASCLIDDERLHVPCRHCGTMVLASIGWLKTHPYCRCSCGSIVRVDRVSHVRQSAATVTAYNALVSRLRALP